MEKSESPRRLRRKAKLIELLTEFGGASQVARESGTPKTHISAMVSGTRGLGDQLAGKLEKRYGKPSGWFDSATHSFQASASIPENQPNVAVAHVHSAQVAINGVADALQFLARSISTSPSKGSDALAGTLVSLSKDPTNPIYQDLLTKMLQPPERPGVESKDFQPSVPSIFTKTAA